MQESTNRSQGTGEVPDELRAMHRSSAYSRCCNYQHVVFDTCDLSGKWILGGSDPVPWEIIEAFVSKGAIVQPNWGMSEIGPIAINIVFDSMDKVQQVKQSAPEGYTVLGDTYWCEWKIDNFELVVKSDTCIYDDWFYTKDLVSLDMRKRMYYHKRILE